MDRIYTDRIATMTEMRDPQKVLDKAGGRPVAVLKTSRLVGWFVPVEAAPGEGEVRVATREEVMAVLEETRAESQPVLDWLKDK